MKLKKFWEWFEKKSEYQNVRDFLCSVGIATNGADLGLELKLKPQCIMGWMIEYLIENEVSYSLCSTFRLEDVYDFLMGKVEELE